MVEGLPKGCAYLHVGFHSPTLGVLCWPLSS